MTVVLWPKNATTSLAPIRQKIGTCIPGTVNDYSNVPGISAVSLVDPSPGRRSGLLSLQSARPARSSNLRIR